MMKLFFLAQILNSDSLPHVDTGTGSDNIKTGLNIAFGILGALAFLMVVVAGVRYIRAGSDTTRVSDAKRQIAHALVGLIVAASAWTIVNFILNRA
jgi:hypothetical protein